MFSGMTRNHRPIKSWQKFGKHVRSKGCDLLSQLDNFPNSVLVSGCQRSGGTMLAGILTKSEGMVNFAWSKDDELDAALILSGIEDHKPQGRYCFQTTYLNECYQEYFEVKSSFKLIWLLRNPHSVVYSLIHNWKRFALNELYLACGMEITPKPIVERYNRFGLISVSRLTRACMSYNAKISQIYEILEKLGPDAVYVVDYDELVTNKNDFLPDLYDFIDLPYQNKYADAILSSSLKKADKLSVRERTMVDELCMPVYEKLRGLIRYKQSV